MGRVPARTFAAQRHEVMVPNLSRDERDLVAALRFLMPRVRVSGVARRG